jgi:hypothetical protein
MASHWTRRKGGAFMATSQKYSKTRKHATEAYAPGPCQCRPRVGEHRPASGCIPQKEPADLSSEPYQVRAKDFKLQKTS